MPLTLTDEQYAALASLARKGSTTPDSQRELDVYLRAIEDENDIKRYTLYVAWVETGTVPPIAARFPETWPPSQKMLMTRYDRPITKQDVVDFANKKGRKPANLMVSRDPGGVLGFVLIDSFFTG